jgi:CRISPR-associated exonuclease Cas4
MESSFLITFILFLLLLTAAFYILFWKVSSSMRSMRLAYGIPDGRVIYSDLDRPAKALRSATLSISGKPDYIVKGRGRSLIPVEIKSGRAREPYRGHVLQLAAYCLLVEECYKRPVPYGIIVYSDGLQHRIDFNRALRSDLLSSIKEMRRSLGHGCPKRGHNHIQKCLHCSFNGSCQSSLAH